MKRALIASAITGLAWSLLVVVLMGGSPNDWMHIPFLAGGLVAGVIAGRQTIRSRKNKDGKERILAGLICYYLALVVFWAVWFVSERVFMCIEHGGWTAFDLRDHLNMLGTYLIYGTIPPWSILLIPLCFANRWFIWKLYDRKATRA